MIPDASSFKYGVQGQTLPRQSADVFICPLMSGGDGALDPILGTVSAQFK